MAPDPPVPQHWLFQTTVEEVRTAQQRAIQPHSCQSLFGEEDCQSDCQSSTVPLPSVLRGRDPGDTEEGGILRQRCGGGFRVVRKRIGGD